jgi:hypothetical protein
MPGVRPEGRGIHAFLLEIVIKIAPVAILLLNESHLPGTRPPLKRLFPLNSERDFLMPLGVDKALQPVAFGEAFDDSVTMLINTSRKIARNTDVERSVWPIGQYADPSSLHGINLALIATERNSWMPATSAGMTK